MDKVPTLRIGENFGRFEITDVLPAGGMGELYRAKDPRLQRDVAIKLLLRSEDHDLKRFEREAQTAAQFSHPNIVGIHDVATEQRGGRDVPYLVMEFIEGTTLRERMRDASKDDVIRWMTEIADGLAELHRRGVVHRDLKPANIMIGIDDHARIVDFGLAKTPGSTVTTEGTIVGTIDYFSPEQAHGLRRLDYRTDIFSFGVVLYEALTGEHPFRRATDLDTMRAIHYESAGRIHGPEGVIVARCLQKAPTDRYDDAADIARALRELEPAPARNAIGRTRAAVDQDATTVKIASASPVSPRPWRLLALVGTLLFAGIVAVVYIWKPRSNPASPPQAAPTTAPVQQATLPTCGLSASPGTITFGDSAQLRWSSSNAADVVIRPEIGIVPSTGRIHVSPRITTTYEIVATNADGIVSTSNVTINVVDAPADFKEVPVVGSIGVGPDKIRRGESTSLGWNSFHATRAVITPSIGIVPLEGRIQVSPRTTTTYTMALTNDAGGLATLTAFVKVDEASPSSQTAAPTREVTCATASQPTVTGTLITTSSSCTVPLHRRVTSAVLTYTLDDEGTISINGRNVFTKSLREGGSREGTVTLPVDLFVPGKSFLLKVAAQSALNPDGTPAGTVYGEAVVRLVTIDEMAAVGISASPGVIKRGETAHLNWTSEDAATLVLNPLVGPVAPNGSLRVSPTQETTYVIRGWSASGDPATARATVQVQ